MGFDHLLIPAVSPRAVSVWRNGFHFLDDFEHLHFKHGTCEFVKSVVTCLQPDSLPDLLYQVQVKLGLVVVQRLKEVRGGDDV